jgi:hypothetical protein
VTEVREPLPQAVIPPPGITGARGRTPPTAVTTGM